MKNLFILAIMITSSLAITAHEYVMGGYACEFNAQGLVNKTVSKNIHASQNVEFGMHEIINEKVAGAEVPQYFSASVSPEPETMAMGAQLSIHNTFVYTNVRWGETIDLMLDTNIETINLDADGDTYITLKCKYNPKMMRSEGVIL